MSQPEAAGTVTSLPTNIYGDESYDLLVSQLPQSSFGDDSYDTLAARLPSGLFHKSSEDFEDACEKRFGVTCELGTIIGHFASSTKFLPPLLCGVDAVVCVVVVFDPLGSLSGAVLCHQPRDCYLLPYMGTTPSSLREWLANLKTFLHYSGVDGFRAKRFSVNVLEAEWRLQALACCDDALGDVLDVQYLASSFLGVSPATALEEACIVEKHGSSCFVKTTQTIHVEPHWVQGLLDCARCRNLKSMVNRALFAPGVSAAAASFLQLRSHVAALAQQGARAGVLIDFNRLNILKQSASSHRPRTPLLKTIKLNCDEINSACALQEDSRYRWRQNYNSVSGEIYSDVQNFPEFSTNLCTRVAVALPSILASVHSPVPPFAAFTFVANARQDVTVLSLLDNGHRVVFRAADGSESECVSSLIQVMQLVRGEHLSVRSAMVSDYGYCFVSVSVPMCPWIFLGPRARNAVVSAFATRCSSEMDSKKLCFDRSEAAACATAAISNLLAEALPEVAAHKRCICMRLALSPLRHDSSSWASQLEMQMQEAETLRSATVAALSEMLTGPSQSQNLPFHAVKPSLLGRRAPSADSFFDASLQHAWMSSADLILSLARESECCLRECFQSELNPESVDVANSDVHSAIEQGSAKNMVDECFSFVALFSQTVAFSCRRNFLHSALDALARSAARLSQSIDVDFPYRVAAGDNVGKTIVVQTKISCIYWSNLICFQETFTAGTARCFTCCLGCKNQKTRTNAGRVIQKIPDQNQSMQMWALQTKYSAAKDSCDMRAFLRYRKQRMMLSRPPMTTINDRQLCGDVKATSLETP